MSIRPLLTASEMQIPTYLQGRMKKIWVKKELFLLEIEDCESFCSLFAKMIQANQNQIVTNENEKARDRKGKENARTTLEIERRQKENNLMQKKNELPTLNTIKTFFEKERFKNNVSWSLVMSEPLPSREGARI